MLISNNIVIERSKINMTIFLAVLAGMIIGFFIGYTLCALFCVNDISAKKTEDEKGDINE